MSLLKTVKYSNSGDFASSDSTERQFLSGNLKFFALAS